MYSQNNYLLKFAEQISFHKVRKSVKGKKLNLNYHEKKWKRGNPPMFLINNYVRILYYYISHKWM